MKFRRNLKEEKTCKVVAIIALILLVIFLTIYFITFDWDWLRFVLLLLFIVPIYFYLAHILKKDFVQFQKDKIIIINHKSVNLEIKISDVEVIMLPSEKALKCKWKENAIIIKRANFKNIVSYTVETEKYINENLDVKTTYYDNYSQALKE